MAQAFNKLGGIFPKGSGKGLAGGAGALITLGALGYGINASLFNGKIPLILSTQHRNSSTALSSDSSAQPTTAARRQPSSQESEPFLPTMP